MGVIIWASRLHGDKIIETGISPKFRVVLRLEYQTVQAQAHNGIK